MRVRRPEVGSIVSDTKANGPKKGPQAGFVGRVVAPDKGLPADVVGRVVAGEGKPGKGHAHFVGRVVAPGHQQGVPGGHFVGRVIPQGQPVPPNAVVVGRVAAEGDKPGAVMVGRVVMPGGGKTPHGAHVVGRVMPSDKKDGAQFVGRVVAPDNEVTTGKGDKFTGVVVGRTLPR